MSRLITDKGFTLLEVLLVLVIFSMALALVAPSASTGLEGLRIKTAGRLVASALNEARFKAVREGRIYFASAAGDRVALRPNGAEGAGKDIHLPGSVSVSPRGGSSIAFYPAGASSGGTFEVGNSERALLAVKVDPSTGRVRVRVLE